MLNELNLGVEFRVVRHQDEVVDRVQTKGNGIQGLSRGNVDAELHAFDNWIRLASVACRSEPHCPGLWARLLVINRTSTRRFWVRPSGVELSATGRLTPIPIIDILKIGTSCLSARYRRTASDLS